MRGTQEPHFARQFEATLRARLNEPVRFIQVVLGPRQVGKTSGVLNVLHQSFSPNEYSYLS